MSPRPIIAALLGFISTVADVTFFTASPAGRDRPWRRVSTRPDISAALASIDATRFVREPVAHPPLARKIAVALRRE